MPEYDKLHQLIHSLSKAEKKNFSALFSESDGKYKKYMDIFKAIESQKTFDGISLSKKLISRGLSIDYLSADKNYLYEQIQRSLLFFNYKRNEKIEVREQIEMIELFFEKGLFGLCLSHISRIKKMIVEYELFSYYFELAQIEKRIRSIQGNTRELAKIQEDELIYKEKLQRIREYDSIYGEIVGIKQQQNIVRSAQVHQRLQTIMSNIILKDIEYATTYTAKIRYYDIHTLYYFLIRDRYREYECTVSKINIMQYGYPIFIRLNPYEYITAHSRLLYLGYIYDQKGFDTIVKTFLSFPETIAGPSRYIEAFVWAFYYNFKCEMYIRNLEFDTARSELKMMKERLDGLLLEVSPALRMTNYYRMAYIYFALDDHENALESINVVLNEQNKNVLSDVTSMGRIFNLIIHLELDNKKVLSNLIGTTYQQLRKANSLNSVEMTLIDLLKKLLIANTPKEKRSAYINTQSKLESMPEEVKISKVLSYFDFNAWMRSKINKTTFLSELKQK